MTIYKASKKFTKKQLFNFIMSCKCRNCPEYWYCTSETKEQCKYDLDDELDREYIEGEFDR